MLKMKPKCKKQGASTLTMSITDLDKVNLDKLGKGGLVLGSSQFVLLSQLPKKSAYFNSGQR